jgi:hypothetical protein
VIGGWTASPRSRRHARGHERRTPRTERSARAAEHLAASRELGDENGLPKNPYRWRVAEAGIRHAEGDVERALELLDDAEVVFFSDFSPDVRPIPAMKARLWIAQGELALARGCAGAHGVSVGDEISYVREFEHATLARLIHSLCRRPVLRLGAVRRPLEDIRHLWLVPGLGIAFYANAQADRLTGPADRCCRARPRQQHIGGGHRILRRRIMDRRATGGGADASATTAIL